MKNAADPLELRLVLEGLPGIIDTINQYKTLGQHLDQDNTILENSLKSMSPYCESESEKQLAKFGDRVSIIVGLSLGGKLDEKEAFNEIKIMYKDLKKLYKRGEEKE
jgi:hypothetical protein